MTNEDELHRLGNGLGLSYHQIKTIQYNHREHINHAGYQVLAYWKKILSEQMSEKDMKEELKTVLRSELVNMSLLVPLYF